MEVNIGRCETCIQITQMGRLFKF